MASETVTRALESGWFRNVLGQYPTGVSVITAIAPDGTPVGMVVGSFTSVSLDPPLVAFMPSAESGSWKRIRDADSFCVNILAADQEPLCRTFASRRADKFAGIDWKPGRTGAPILPGIVAWIECDREATHEAGDHHIVLGRVRELDIARSTLPLLFYQGGYGRFSPLSLAIRDERFGRQLQLVDRARPLMEEIAQRLSAQVLAAHCDGTELTLLASAGNIEHRHIPAASIGQRVPVVAPIGMWWIPFAAPEHVEAWLRGVEDPARRDAYTRALDGIRQHGYCLGLETVYDRVEALLSKRPAAGIEPTHEERRQLTELAVDPTDYVPPDPVAEVATGELISLWAPVRSRGRVELGLMLSTRRRPETGLTDYGQALLTLAQEVAELSEEPVAIPRSSSPQPQEA